MKNECRSNVFQKFQSLVIKYLTLQNIKKVAKYLKDFKYNLKKIFVKNKGFLYIKKTSW